MVGKDKDQGEGVKSPIDLDTVSMDLSAMLGRSDGLDGEGGSCDIVKEQGFVMKKSGFESHLCPLLWF